MKLKSVLPWYALALIVLLCAALMVREGFESSPGDLQTKLSGKKALVMFYSKDCGHCKTALPEFENAARDEPDKMTTVDVTNQSDENVQKIMKEYNVDGFPTFVVVENGTHKPVNVEDRTKEEFLKVVRAF